MSIDKVFFIFEIIGTVAFAITGVITAIEKKLDIFGFCWKICSII